MACKYFYDHITFVYIQNENNRITLIQQSIPILISLILEGASNLRVRTSSVPTSHLLQSHFDLLVFKIFSALFTESLKQISYHSYQITENVNICGSITNSVDDNLRADSH